MKILRTASILFVAAVLVFGAFAPETSAWWGHCGWGGHGGYGYGGCGGCKYSGWGAAGPVRVGATDTVDVEAVGTGVGGPAVAA
ncbi:MAG TPA: hypothetical protein VGP63_20230 [Planctomycetaceae bacterium]|jgi:hypothetical protein|nr:hypothetical protein [Planctomycetaceae bacterium]